MTTTITPPYRFVWQVSGHIDTLNGPDTVVALLDYRTGKLLYDVRHDLTPSQGATEPGTPPSAAAVAGRLGHPDQPGRDALSAPMIPLAAGATTGDVVSCVLLLVLTFVVARHRQPSHGATRRRRLAPALEQARRPPTRPACGWRGD